jgi:glycosyltransferase involved in cell wall biosynthesis
MLRTALERAGVGVVEARVPERRAVFRWPALAARFGAAGMRADRVLVPEFRHKDVPLARLLAGRRPLVFDPLVSRWDTLVSDWALHREGSAQARWNLMIDRWSFRLADLVLCDTWAHGRLFESLGARRDRLARVPVGAEDAFFAVAPPPGPGPVRVLYAGGFLPLHGVPVVIEALARLERRAAALPAYEVVLAGSGIDHDAVRQRAAALGLTRVGFPGRTRYEDLPARLAAAHVVLGAFGAGEKAGRVVPHKVWQGLAAGRAVVTGDGPGLREWFEPGADVMAVRRGDAGAIAAALETAIADAGLRARLGRAGRERAHAAGSVEAVGRALLEALEKVA